MAEQLRALKLDKKYNVDVFSAKTASLQRLKSLLEEYLRKTGPPHERKVAAAEKWSVKAD